MNDREWAAQDPGKREYPDSPPTAPAPLHAVDSPVGGEQAPAISEAQLGNLLDSIDDIVTQDGSGPLSEKALDRVGRSIVFYVNYSASAPVEAPGMASVDAAEDARDAARYRWLRDGQNWDCFDWAWLGEMGIFGDGPNDMDAAIDAARQESK